MMFSIGEWIYISFCVGLVALLFSVRWEDGE
jgi:hypothetical protein